MISEAPKLMTARELGRQWSISPQVILTWFHAGIIPAEIAIGHVYRFDREKVAEALATQSKPQGKP